MEKEIPRDQILKFILIGLKRIILGLFKIYFLAEYAKDFSLFSFDTSYLTIAPWWKILLFSYVSVIELYLNFSGYSDLAVGISKIFLLNIPENFNQPFKARNLQDLWQRWHMSLSSWLKTYLFLPLFKNLFSISWLKSRPLIIQPIAIFTTFFIMGIWHGLDNNFLIYGFLQGAGLFCVIFWDNVLKKKKYYKQYKNNLFISVFSRLITWTYFAFCIALFNAATTDKLNLLIKIITNEK
jgi:membrane protein involved in D-alanine export